MVARWRFESVGGIMLCSRFGSMSNNILKHLNKPFNTKPIYARNVWDMQVFDGKIYLGSGNASNDEPSANTPPDGIISLDPTTKIFTNEFLTFDDKQLDLFKILNGALCIPGIDRMSGTIGNFYRKEIGENWIMTSSIGTAVFHVYGAEYFGGNLFVAAGPSGNSEGMVFTSSDNGATWTSPLDSSFIANNSELRIRQYGMFTLGGKLYSIMGLLMLPWDDRALCIEGVAPNFTYSMVVCKNLKGSFPVLSYGYFTKIHRPTEFMGALLYILAWVYNDHQCFPISLMRATDINTASAMVLPEVNAIPIDIILRDNNTIMYVLAYIKRSNTSYTNIVYSSVDGINYIEVLRFDYETFARSFEEINGVYYFGTGCYTDILSEATGHILQIDISDCT